MEIALLLALAFTINKVVTVIKAVASGDKNMYATQILVWVVGFLGLLLAASSSLTNKIVVIDGIPPLGSLEITSLALLGLILGSTGSFAFDLKKAVDNGDTAVEPPLLQSAKPANNG